MSSAAETAATCRHGPPPECGRAVVPGLVNLRNGAGRAERPCAVASAAALLWAIEAY